MNYKEVQLSAPAELAEILMAELAELGFESFTESEDGLNAYITEGAFSEERLAQLIEKYNGPAAIAYSVQTLEKKNWNEEWEKSYAPIEVGKSIRVRASFHEPDPSFTYELLINPKMSFGTGHHETTWLVMNAQLELPHEGIRLMDVGCGTGILAILGARLGAKAITAFDIDEWATENTIENFTLNGGSSEDHIFRGTIHDLDPGQKFGGILANINRNILLEQIPTYVRHLEPEGWMVVSGFYENDRKDIESCAAANGLIPVRSDTRNQWAAVVFRKI